MDFLPGFTSKYRVTRLVYYEETPNSRAAVARERQLRQILRFAQDDNLS
jgi:putative endonuclease